MCFLTIYYVVSFTILIQFTLRKIIDNMQNANFNPEDLDDKVAKAIELSKKKAEKKKQEKKEVAVGP